MPLQSSPFVHWQGGKSTVAYQVTVNYSGRVLTVTEGFTGSTNDKTIICWDTAVDHIRKDKNYTDKQFDVYNEDGTPRTLKGCYLLVDNGYHKLNNRKVTLRTSLFYSSQFSFRQHKIYSLLAALKNVFCCVVMV